jgi:uncharacterized protein YaeQ
MASGATVYVFTVRLADADRGVYETLNLRLARHPSETAEYLLTRLLAYCLEYTEGIALSSGLSEPDEPAIAVRDLTGMLLTWIEVGLPEAARLHKAAKAARRVVVYAHRDTGPWLLRLKGAHIHRGAALEIRIPDRELLGALVACLERRMDLELAVAEQTLYLTVGAQTFSGALDLQRLAD